MSSFQDKLDSAKSVRQQLELLTEEIAVLFQPIKILCKLSDSGFNFLSPPLEWTSDLFGVLVDREEISSLALLSELKKKRAAPKLELEPTDLPFCKIYSMVSDYQGIPEIDVCIVRSEEFREYEEEKLRLLLSQASFSVRKARLELLSIRKSQSNDSLERERNLKIAKIEEKFSDAGVLKLEVNRNGLVLEANALTHKLGIIGDDSTPEKGELKITHHDLQKAVLKVSDENPILIQRITAKYNSESRIYLVRMSFDSVQNTITCIGTDVTAEHRLSFLAKRQEEGYSAISRVVQASGEVENLEEYLEQVVPLLSTALDAKAGIVIVDGQRVDARQIVSTYLIDKHIVDLTPGSELNDLISWAKRSKEVVVIPHLTESKGAFNFLNGELTPSNCVICPLTFGSKILGVVILVYQFKGIAFDDSFLILVKTVAAHIAGSITQMQLIEETKSNQRIIHALYRLSHELSQFLSLEQLFQKSFEIMHSELNIDRFWLGLLNETSTRLVGSSAYGEGWKKKLVEVNIDISSDTHPLAEVIKYKKPLLLKNTGDILRGLGIKRFIEKNEIDSVGLVPLVAGGQVLGVLAFEGERLGRKLNEDDLNILSSLAAELASVLLSKKLEERVTAGETMRASGLLAAGIAHNFNNLLQGILGQASLLELYSNKPEQVQKSARLITEASTKGASLVRQLMSFAHLEEPQSEEVEVNSMVERNKPSFQRLLHERQYIVYNLSEKLPQIYADPSQVLRILQVLVSNSRDAMGVDGRLEIITDFVEIGKNSPHYEVPYGKYVRIGIRDDGIGMDLETKRRCFEPFFTTKNVDPSSGLSLSGEGMGLAAGFALAKKNGGRLVVDSRKGHGSLFTLYLPIDPPKVRNTKSYRLKDDIEVEPVGSSKVNGESIEIDPTQSAKSSITEREDES